MERKRFFYTEVITDSIEPGKKALAKSIGLAIASNVTEVVICIPQRGTLQGFEAELLDEKMCDSLINNGVYSQSGITFYVSTNRKMLQKFTNGPLLGLEAKPEELTKLGKDPRVSAIVYLPRMTDEIDYINREEFEKIAL